MTPQISIAAQEEEVYGSERGPLWLNNEGREVTDGSIGSLGEFFEAGRVSHVYGPRTMYTSPHPTEANIAFERGLVPNEQQPVSCNVIEDAHSGRRSGEVAQSRAVIE